jgi:hypothetical protein
MAVNENAPMTEASGPTGDETPIHQAAERPREVAKEIVEELPAHEWAADTIRKLTIQAPLQSFAIAFLLSVIVGSRAIIAGPAKLNAMGRE